MRPRRDLLHLHYHPEYGAIWSSDNHLLFDVTDVTIFVIGRGNAISVWHISGKLMAECAARCDKLTTALAWQQEYFRPDNLHALNAYHDLASDQPLGHVYVDEQDEPGPCDRPFLAGIKD